MEERPLLKRKAHALTSKLHIIQEKLSFQVTGDLDNKNQQGDDISSKTSQPEKASGRVVIARKSGRLTTLSRERIKGLGTRIPKIETGTTAFLSSCTLHWHLSTSLETITAR